MFRSYFLPPKSNFLAPERGKKGRKDKHTWPAAVLVLLPQLWPGQHGRQSHSGLLPLAKKQEAHSHRHSTRLGDLSICLFTCLWKCLLFYFLPQVHKIDLTKLCDLWNSIILVAEGFIPFLKAGKMNTQSYFIISWIPSCHHQSACPTFFLTLKTVRRIFSNSPEQNQKRAECWLNHFVS